MNIIQELSRFNGITFFDHNHTYNFEDGSPSRISTTALIGKFEPFFDTANISARVASRDNRTVTSVLAEWEEKKVAGCTKGTNFHAYAENRINSRVFPSVVPPTLQKQFLAFMKHTKNVLIPVKSEWVIGDKTLGITGMIDQLFFNLKTKKFHIFDWKTNNKMDMESLYDQFMTPPVDHLDSCNFNTYSLQLAVYRYILETNTKLPMGKSALVWFHEDNDNYEIIPTKNYKHEVSLILEFWKNNLISKKK